ncbi:hypothetical protein [Albidovulum sp.]|jgi:hypothetical protein|uniref:hypothetical protein n=1 Tax=Albidovulum sp. TaxID=1872424 RepID=UPI0030474DAA
MRETVDRAGIVEVRDIKEAIGNLVILSAKLEQTLAAEIVVLGGGIAPHYAGQKLAVWKALHDAAGIGRPRHAQIVDALHPLLCEALRVRNGICHGLRGYCADPSGFEPVSITFDLDGVTETVSWARLQAIMQLLATTWSWAGRLTIAARRPDLAGISNIYDDFEQRIIPLPA